MPPAAQPQDRDMTAGQFPTTGLSDRAELSYPIPGERRLRRRFPLKLGFEYSVKSEDSPISGAGRTIDLSSSGLRFTADRPLAVGLPMQVAIEWPQTLGNGVPLRLVLSAEVVRRAGGEIAGRIYQWEFRIRGSR